MKTIKELITIYEQKDKEWTEELYGLDWLRDEPDYSNLMGDIVALEKEIKCLKKIDKMVEHYNINTVEPFSLSVEGVITGDEYSLFIHYRRNDGSICPTEKPILRGSMEDMITWLKNILVGNKMEVPQDEEE